MQTLIAPDCSTATAWLELAGSREGIPEKIVLDKFPFVIGRGESADLQVDSSAVSREHAAIEHAGREYRLRDLGSTNGTFLNGRRIQESPLSDGDVLLAANIEITFFEAQRDRIRTTVTHLLTAESPAGGSAGAACLIGQLRRAREAVTLGCVRPLLEPIVDLRGRDVVGYEERPDDEPGTSWLDALDAADSRLASRMHDLRRMKAAEATHRSPRGGSLFVRAAGAELGGEGLAESLGRLTELLAEDWRLVVQMPYEVACTLDRHPLTDRLRDLGMSVAYDGFAGRQSPWSRQPDLKLDYLKIAESLVRAMPRNAEGRRQVQGIVRAAQEHACVVIACGIRTQDEAEACREAGCRLGQGPLNGPPQRSLDPVGQAARIRVKPAESPQRP